MTRCHGNHMFYIFTIFHQLAKVRKLFGSGMLVLNVIGTILSVVVHLITTYENVI